MPLCPQCSAEVAAKDTHCMDCGADLIAAREKERQVLREISMAARTGAGKSAVAVTGAAAGMAAPGERSDETRIRAFDRQEAERLAQERTTAWVTAGIALVAALALLAVGLNRLKAAGGFGDVPELFKPANLRDSEYFAGPTMLGLLFLGMGLAGLLTTIGQTRMALATTRAIEQVRSNLKPDIVHVSTFTVIGFVVLAVFCPPAGLVVGLVLRFGRNPDLRPVGGTMTVVSAAVLGLFLLNLLGGLAQSLKHGAAK